MRGCGGSSRYRRARCTAATQIVQTKFPISTNRPNKYLGRRVLRAVWPGVGEHRQEGLPHLVPGPGLQVLKGPVCDNVRQVFTGMNRYLQVFTCMNRYLPVRDDVRQVIPLVVAAMLPQHAVVVEGVVVEPEEGRI